MISADSTVSHVRHTGLFRALAATVAALILVFFSLSAAQAEPPVTVPGNTSIVDNAGILSSEQISDLNEKLSDGEVRLVTVIVDSFDNPSSPDQWAIQTASKSSLDGTVAVLAITTNRQFAISYSQSLANSFTQSNKRAVTEAFTSQLSNKELNASNLETAIESTKDSLEAQYSARSGSGSDSGDGGSIAPVIIGGGAVAGAGALAYYVYRRRAGGKKETDFVPQLDQHGQPLDPLDALDIPKLRTQAGSLLLAADDAVKSSEQELAFAQAQYGDEAITTFAQDIEIAKEHLNASFHLQQQLDDDIPDTEEEQRTWLKDIIRRSEAVNTTLDEHKADFDSLRELERKAPEVLASAQSQAQQLSSRIAQAEATVARMAQSYEDSALVQVNNNVQEAKDRIEFTETAAGNATEALQSGDTAQAAVAVRSAEESVYQAGVLLDAINKAEPELAQARKDLEESVVNSAQDLAQARALIASGANPELAGGVASVETALAGVKESLSAGRIDPLALLATLQNADAQLSPALNAIRDQQEQARKALEVLQQWINAASSQISGTQDFIRARRGGVGTQARTRLAEAERNLKQAIELQSSDPVNSLSYAQQANALAQQAAQQAQDDVDRYNNDYDMFGGGRGGGGVNGAMLGGILLGQILGGGHSGGGNNGGGGYGGFGGGFGGGSFGGGGGFSSGGSGSF